MMWVDNSQISRFGKKNYFIFLEIMIIVIKFFVMDFPCCINILLKYYKIYYKTFLWDKSQINKALRMILGSGSAEQKGS